MFQRLLDYSTSVHLKRQSKDVALHLHREGRLLSLITILEELLDDVVTKDIRHELERARSNFIEHSLFVRAGRSLEFLLNKSRTVLIPAKLDNVTENVLAIRSHIEDLDTFRSYFLFFALRNSSSIGLRRFRRLSSCRLAFEPTC